MEEIEYLEEYEEIVMPHDPYDLLPVDPAFDEFIEEDPLCSVYRNDFQFGTASAAAAANSSQAIATDSHNLHIDHETIVTTSSSNECTRQEQDTTESVLVGQENHVLESSNCPSSSMSQYDNDASICENTNHMPSSESQTAANNESGVKVLSCKTLDTSAFLNIGTGNQTKPIIENPILAISRGNRNLFSSHSPIDYMKLSSSTSTNNLISTSALTSPISPHYQRINSYKSDVVTSSSVSQQKENNLVALSSSKSFAHRLKLARDDWNPFLALSAGVKTRDVFKPYFAARGFGGSGSGGYKNFNQYKERHNSDPFSSGDIVPNLAVKSSSLVPNKIFVPDLDQCIGMNLLKSPKNHSVNALKAPELSKSDNNSNICNEASESPSVITKASVKQFEEFISSTGPTINDRCFDDSLDGHHDKDNDNRISPVFATKPIEATNHKPSTSYNFSEEVVNYSSPVQDTLNQSEIDPKYQLNDTKVSEAQSSPVPELSTTLSNLSESTTKRTKSNKINTGQCLADDIIVAKSTSLNLRQTTLPYFLKDKNSTGPCSKFDAIMKPKSSMINKKEGMTSNSNIESTVNNIGVNKNYKSNESQKQNDTVEPNELKAQCKLNSKPISDAISSPKVLQVVLPRSSIKSKRDSVKETSSEISRSDSIDKNIEDSSNHEIEDVQQDSDKEVEDILKGITCDPLKTIHNEQQPSSKDDDKILKKKRDRNVTCINDFELLARNHKSKRPNQSSGRIPALTGYRKASEDENTFHLDENQKHDKIEDSRNVVSKQTNAQSVISNSTRLSNNEVVNTNLKTPESDLNAKKVVENSSSQILHNPETIITFIPTNPNNSGNASIIEEIKNVNSKIHFKEIIQNDWPTSPSENGSLASPTSSKSAKKRVKLKKLFSPKSTNCSKSYEKNVKEDEKPKLVKENRTSKSQHHHINTDVSPKSKDKLKQKDVKHEVSFSSRESELSGDQKIVTGKRRKNSKCDKKTNVELNKKQDISNSSKKQMNASKYDIDSVPRLSNLDHSFDKLKSDSSSNVFKKLKSPALSMDSNSDSNTVKKETNKNVKKTNSSLIQNKSNYTKTPTKESQNQISHNIIEKDVNTSQLNASNKSEESIGAGCSTSAANTRKRKRKINNVDSNNKMDDVFFEPNIMTRALSKRVKRNTGVAVVPDQSATKIIRRRQSNIIQVSRKEYERLVNENRHANAQRVTRADNIEMPTLYPEFEIKNPKDFKMTDEDYIRKYNIKRAKVVVEKLNLKLVMQNLATRKNMMPPNNVTNKKHHGVNMQKETEISRKCQIVTDELNVGKSKNIKRLSETENEFGSKKNEINSKHDKDNQDDVTFSLKNVKVCPGKRKKVTSHLHKDKKSKNDIDDVTSRNIESSEALNNQQFKINAVKNVCSKELERNSADFVDETSANTMSEPQGTSKSKNTSNVSITQKSNRSSSEFIKSQSNQLKQIKSISNFTESNVERSPTPEQRQDSERNIKTKNTTIPTNTKKQPIELNRTVTRGRNAETLNMVQKPQKVELTSNVCFSSTPNKLTNATPELIRNSTNKEKFVNDSQNQGKRKFTEKHNLNKNPLLNENNNLKPNILKAVPENQRVAKNIRNNLVASNSVADSGTNKNNSETNSALYSCTEDAVVSIVDETETINLDFSIESWFQDVPSQRKTVIVNESDSSSTSTLTEQETLNNYISIQSSDVPVLLSPTVAHSSQLLPSSLPPASAQVHPCSSTNINPGPLQNQLVIIPASPILVAPQQDVSYSAAPQKPPTPSKPIIKSISIPAHIVVQTKFLTREQYIEKIMKSPSGIGNGKNPLITNTQTDKNNKSVMVDGVQRKQNTSKIIQRISDLLETQIDAEVRRKLQDFIENKSAEDALRSERLANVNKMGYNPEFALQMYVFLQNYFFNSSSTMEILTNYDSVVGGSGSGSVSGIGSGSVSVSGNGSGSGGGGGGRGSGGGGVGRLSNTNQNLKPPNQSVKITDTQKNQKDEAQNFSFRKIRLPVMDNSSNTPISTMPIPQPPPIPFINNIQSNPGTIILPTASSTATLSNTPTQENARKLAQIGQSSHVPRTRITRHNLPIPADFENPVPAITLRQSTSVQGEQVNMEFYLNSGSYGPNIAEPESILPDDSAAIIHPPHSPQIKEEENLDESTIIS